jgi:hypothetical protein
VGVARSIPSPLQAAAYARSARRLRAKWKDQPARLHRELRDLPGEVFTNRPLETPAEKCGVPAGRHAMFADMAASLIEGGVLRYSARLQLIAAAGCLGIGRFDANLIIAAVQHRARPLPAKRSGRRIWRPAHLVAAVLAVECAAILAVAWLWVG